MLQDVLGGSRIIRDEVGLRKSGMVKKYQGRLRMFEDTQAWSRMFIDGKSW